jgi:hypothetical protein
MMEQRDKIHPFSSRLVRWLTISLFITISGISYLVYLMVSTVMTDVTCTQRMHELDYTIERINGLVNIVELAAKNHDALIEENLGNPTMLDAKLREIVVENPKLMGVGLAFIEDYYPEVGRWCELYVTRDDHGTSVEQIGSAEHDYFKSQWFQKGLLADKTDGCWSDAYYDDSGAHALLTTFSLPIHDKSGKVIAVLETGVGFLVNEAVALGGFDGVTEVRAHGKVHVTVHADKLDGAVQVRLADNVHLREIRVLGGVLEALGLDDFRLQEGQGAEAPTGSAAALVLDGCDGVLPDHGELQRVGSGLLLLCRQQAARQQQDERCDGSLFHATKIQRISELRTW